MTILYSIYCGRVNSTWAAPTPRPRGRLLPNCNIRIMNENLLKETEERILSLYKQLSAMLLNPANYTVDQPDTELIQQYLSVLEKALQKPYNRIAHLHALLSDPDGLMVGRMQPFCFLSGQVQVEVNKLYQQTERLVSSAEVLEPQSTRVLEWEPHEMK